MGPNIVSKNRYICRFLLCHRPYLLWSPVIVEQDTNYSEKKGEQPKTVPTAAAAVVEWGRTKSVLISCLEDVVGRLL